MTPARSAGPEIVVATKAAVFATWDAARTMKSARNHNLELWFDCTVHLPDTTERCRCLLVNLTHSGTAPPILLMICCKSYEQPGPLRKGRRAWSECVAQ